jgi:type I restriction enzyme M protein
VSKNRHGNGHRSRKGEILFIDARPLGQLETRKWRVFDPADISRVSATYQAWRSTAPETPYADVPGFARSVPVEEIADHGYVLTPGRYVGATDAEIDDEPSLEKLERLREELYAEFDEGIRLEALIRARLDDLL